MTQQELREKCLWLQDNYGTTAAFIARKIGVSKTTVSFFLKDQRVLADALAKKLEKFLDNLENLK